jgi:hypothetical protein
VCGLVESLVFVVGHWRWAVVSLNLLKSLLLSRDDLPNGGARLKDLDASCLIMGGCCHPIILRLVNKPYSFLFQLLGPKRLDLEFLVILPRRRVLVALLFLSESCDPRKLIYGQLFPEDYCPLSGILVGPGEILVELGDIAYEVAGFRLCNLEVWYLI